MVWRKKQQHCYSAWTSEPGCFTRSWGVFTKSIQLSLLFTLYSWLSTEVSCWYNADPSKVENKTLSFVVNSNPEYVPVIRKFEHSQSISCFSTSLLYGSILQFILCWLIDTGWSKKTVNCNFFLTDPNFLKNAKPQWFLESLDRAVLVFWCFKSVRWM